VYADLYNQGMSFNHRLLMEKEELRVEKNYKKFSEWFLFSIDRKGESCTFRLVTLLIKI